MAGAAAAWGLLLAVCVAAPPAPVVERVLVKAGKVLAVQGGVTNEITSNVSLPGEITVMTNCAFRIKEGKERVLKEGQVLGADGVLMNPDGSVEPVADHVLLKNGRVVVYRDGEASPLAAPITLGNGTTITADGYITRGYGGSDRMLDGQMYRLDGRPMPVEDTIMLIHGRVRVQKDGSSFAVPRGSSLMMNDGTKVLGNGTLVTMSGSTRKLAEGEIVVVPGVVRRK